MAASPSLCVVGGYETTDGEIPSFVMDGVLALRAVQRPSDLFDADEWARMIRDAEALIVSGWATQALKLGWRPIELFGFGNTFDGLACWLQGRRLALLDERSAIVSEPDGARFVYRRTDPRDAVMLWDWRDLREPS